jgi:hypothetical protein
MLRLLPSGGGTQRHQDRTPQSQAPRRCTFPSIFEDAVFLYPDAEAVRTKVPRRGPSMILKPTWVNS